MCCIFTCCGWMIDLAQRLVTFTMSCCISSAVCCVLLTASMAGIGLGYNYSLAEYVDLKETNVSVYLKRGMFDDEVGEAKDWRRSGSNLVGGGEENPPEESTTPQIGRRRLDDSILESDDSNKYEGHLFKLTARPPSVSTVDFFTPVPGEQFEAVNEFTKESMDRVKAVQAYINMRKANAASARRSNNLPLLPEDLAKQNKDIVPDAIKIYPEELKESLPHDKDKTINPLRLAVPNPDMLTFDNWVLPKLSEKEQKKIYGHSIPPHYIRYITRETASPEPVTPRFGPIRPTRPRTTAVVRSTNYHSITRSHESFDKDMDKELREYKDKSINNVDNNKFESKNLNEKNQNSNRKIDDYDENSIGLSVRRKRNAIIKTSSVPTAKESNSPTSITFAIDNAQNNEDKEAEGRSFFKLFKSLLTSSQVSGY